MTKEILEIQKTTLIERLDGRIQILVERLDIVQYMQQRKLTEGLKLQKKS